MIHLLMNNTILSSYHLNLFNVIRLIISLQLQQHTNVVVHVLSILASTAILLNTKNLPTNIDPFVGINFIYNSTLFRFNQKKMQNSVRIAPTVPVLRLDSCKYAIVTVY